jgi:hypothetical protein
MAQHNCSLTRTDHSLTSDSRRMETGGRVGHIEHWRAVERHRPSTASSYAMLLVMVLAPAARAKGSEFDPPPVTAVLGLTWNLCALPA